MILFKVTRSQMGIVIGLSTQIYWLLSNAPKEIKQEEKDPQKRSASKKMHRLSEAIYLAKKVGTLLGRRQILLKAMFR